MLVDSHVHLDMPQFEDDLEEVVERAEKVGITEMLNASYDKASLGRTVALTERFDKVYGACGIHPHDSKDFDKETEGVMKRFLLRKKILAVGEVGLDYYRDLTPRDVQRDIFRRQIGIALYFRKPLIIHSRESFDDVARIVEEEGAGEVGGIFHAFSLGEDELKLILRMGFIVGIGGPLTYKNSRLPEALRRLPSDAFVLETDSPYLPPHPHRGKRNEPAYVALVRDRLAEIMGVEPGDIERASHANYMRVIHRSKPKKASMTYELKGALYLNITNSCTNNCTFCPRSEGNYELYGENLNLIVDPSAEELVEEARQKISSGVYREIVFCGFGEPTSRLDDILKIARELKSLGLPLRLNTNGQGNLVHGRNIVPELEEVFDRVSISLNASSKNEYLTLCRPDFGPKAFDAVIDFIEKAAASRMECIVTALDIPSVDMDACRRVVDGISGVQFNVRRYRFVKERL